MIGWIQSKAIEIIVYALVLAALVGLWKHHEASVYQRGYDAAVSERKAKDDAELSKAKESALVKERDLREQMDKDALERAKEKQDYEATISGLRRDALVGRSGLRCPTAIVRPNSTPTDPSTSSRSSSEERSSDLMPEAADAVLSAGSDLAQSMRERNALIDAYNRVRVVCN